MPALRRTPVAAVSAVVVAAAGLLVVPGSAGAASTDPIDSVKVTVTAPHWARTESAGNPYVRVRWAATSALPSGVNVGYDVQYREQDLVGGADYRTPWEPFQTHVSTLHAHLTTNVAEGIVETGDSYRLRARAVNLDTGATGPWSDVVISNVVVDDRIASQAWLVDYKSVQYGGSQWRTTHAAGDYFGSAHTTTRKKPSAIIIWGGFSGRRFAIFGTKCPTCGSFVVGTEDGRRLHHSGRTVVVHTHSKTVQHGVLLASIPLKDSVFMVANITTQPRAGHRRVTIDGWTVGD